MNAEQSNNYELLPPAATESPGAVAEQHEAGPKLRPWIWVASLLDHEYTVHHGAWVEANQPLAGVRAGIDRMLTASPVARQTGTTAHRWAIFYHHGFAGYPLGVHEGLQRVSQIGRGLAQHGPAFAAWATVAHDDHLEDFEAAFLGHYDDLRSYIEQRVNDLSYDEVLDRAVPASLRPYVKIDLAATAHDMQRGGDLRAVPAQQGGVWIFNGQ